MPVPVSWPFILPSEGILYGNSIPEGKVEILPMLGEHQEQLAAINEANSRSIMRNISKQLIKLPQNFSVDDLLMSDWGACMLAIHAYSISSEFNLTPQCPNPRCGENFSATVEFASLKKYEAKDFLDLASYKEPFEIKELPFSKEHLSFRLYRVKDMERSENFAKQAKNAYGNSSPKKNYDIALHIISINGVSVTPMQALDWLRKAIGGDVSFIEDEIRSWETGFDYEMEFDCTKCGKNFRSYMPLDGGLFFRRERNGRDKRKKS